MSCFKRGGSPDHPQPTQATTQPLLEKSEDPTPRQYTPTTNQETPVLVMQASDLAARVQKQKDRLNREKDKPSSTWNILRRGSSAIECKKNDETAATPAIGSLKQRQMSLVASMSPKVDSAKKRLIHFRRQTTTDAAPNHRYDCPQSGLEGGRGRMSIVAKDWDSVHKVHDPESDVGGVYIGDEEGNGSKRSKVTNGRANGEFQGAFTAMKISESTDCNLSMIDDEAKE